jgi:mono/diheme cytochrome c family protein
MRVSSGTPWLRRSAAVIGIAAVAATVVAFTGDLPAGSGQEVDEEQILLGRQLVLEHGCGGCHGGFANPEAEDWMVGLTSPAQEFLIGPCAVEPGATPCFRTRPRNLTPDNTTGVGRFSERQIFNALRYGLRPGETADVEITSAVPGEGNFPEFPKYLAPPMPWVAWRHMPDEDLWAIAAYLKHGVKPVSNQVEDSEGPPDFWESDYTDEVYGTYPAKPFPASRERTPDSSVDAEQVAYGRQMVLEHACGDCHGGFQNTDGEGYLMGVTDPIQVFPFGPCLVDPSAPCFMMRPRNLTPDEETGLGRFTERQIFNAIRYGLRPSGTPDMEITPDNFPEDPDYLAPGMPWMELRHMADEDIRAIATYLKHGLLPQSNSVEDSDRPEEGWASEYKEELFGTYPAPPFPTAREVGG